jgi:hypothetical protein
MLVWSVADKVYGPFEDANEAFAWAETHQSMSAGGGICRVIGTAFEQSTFQNSHLPRWIEEAAEGIRPLAEQLAELRTAVDAVRQQLLQNSAVSSRLSA